MPPTNTFHLSFGWSASAVGVAPELRLSWRKRGQALVGSACGLVDITSSSQRWSPHTPAAQTVPFGQTWSGWKTPSIPHFITCGPMQVRSPGAQAQTPSTQAPGQGEKS